MGSHYKQSTEYVLEQTKIDLPETAGTMGVNSMENFDRAKRRTDESPGRRLAILASIAVLSVTAVIGMVFFVMQMFWSR